MVVGTPELITHENFGDDRIRDFGAAGDQILPFPIDFDRRPYNTLALLCECVIETNQPPQDLLSPLPSNRQYLSCDACLEVKKDDKYLIKSGARAKPYTYGSPPIQLATVSI